MIPRIAHFHWTGGPMTWMRLVSIATFKKFNPSWEIRLHDTPPDIREHGLDYAKEADWTWWRMLARHGGFQVATDIVFVRPIPDAWLDCDINVCTNGTEKVYQFAMSGAVAGHSFFVNAEKACEELSPGAKSMGYQAMGADLLKSIKYKFERPEWYGQPMESLCYWNCSQPPSLWGKDVLNVPEDIIGIHWYGGHPISKDNEPKAVPGYDAAIVRLAESLWLP